MNAIGTDNVLTAAARARVSSVAVVPAPSGRCISDQWDGMSVWLMEKIAIARSRTAAEKGARRFGE